MGTRKRHFCSQCDYEATVSGSDDVGMAAATGGTLTGGALSRPSALVNYEVPDVRPLAQVVGMYNQTLLRSDPTKLELLNHINALSRLELLPPEELPSEWLSYSCCDLVIVGLDDLVAMKRDFPENQGFPPLPHTGELARAALLLEGDGKDPEGNPLRNPVPIEYELVLDKGRWLVTSSNVLWDEPC